MGDPSPPYVAVVRAGDWLAVAGQVGARDGVLVSDRFIDQVGQALRNLEGHLERHGAQLDHLVSTTVYLTDITDLPALDDTYLRFFGDLRPARSSLAVSALPLGARVAIEAWAHVGGKP